MRWVQSKPEPEKLQIVIGISDQFAILAFSACPEVDLEKISDFRYFGVAIALFDIVVGTFGNLFTILAQGWQIRASCPMNLCCQHLCWTNISSDFI